MGLKMPKISVKNVNPVVAGALGGMGVGVITKYLKDKEGSKKDTSTEDASIAAAAQYDTARNTDRQRIADLAKSTVPGVTAAALDPMWRQKQADLVSVLQAQAAGQGPSIAQQQFQQASNTALQKTMGAIRAATGTNAGLSARTAALAGTNLLGQAASESGMARLKEQQDAQTALSNALAAGRTADMQQRAQDIQLGQGNADSALKQQQIAADLYKSLLGETSTRYESNYNRGAQVAAAKNSARGGGDNIMGSLIGTAGAVIGGIYGGPGGAAAGGAAGKAVGDAAAPQSGAGLVGNTPAPSSGLQLSAKAPLVRNQQTNARLRGNPFGKVAR